MLLEEKTCMDYFGTFQGQKVDESWPWHAQACVLLVYLLKKCMQCCWKSLFRFPSVGTEVQICLPKGVGPGTTTGCSVGSFLCPHDWRPAWTPMLLETRWQGSSPAGLCVRTLSSSGSDLAQGLKSFRVWQHRISVFLLPIFRNWAKAVKSSVNYIGGRGGKINLSLAIFCFEDFWRRIWKRIFHLEQHNAESFSKLSCSFLPQIYFRKVN